MNTNLTTEESKLILQKMGKLPIQFRNEVLSFMDYVFVKYQDEANFINENLELSEYGKSFLDERMEAMKANSQSNSSWQDVKKRLYQKNNWEQ